MFSQLFFLLLTLVLINFSSGTSIPFWTHHSGDAFELGMLSYVLLLILLYGQSRLLNLIKRTRLSAWDLIVNVEILSFLAVYHFGFGAHRFFSSSYQPLSVLLSLSLYFFALGWSQLCRSRYYLHHSLKKSFKTAYHHISFYIPLSLPFFLMMIVLDGVQHLPLWRAWTSSFLSEDLLLFLMSLAIICFSLIFLPPMMMLCWRCKEIKHPLLRERLEKACTSLNFRHGGLKTWSVMPHSYTAGIIGVFPALRYILFTPRLLNQFHPDEIEAILTHEIGHSRHRHLLLYPVILFGMGIAGTLFLIGLEAALKVIIGQPGSEISSFLLTTTLFIAYAVAMWLYFRLVFGFFSRLFERQADLHIFASSLPPEALIGALDRLGTVTGNTHSDPSWHHFSLQERICFLSQAVDNPLLVSLHHQRVRRWMIIYLIALLACSFTLFWMIEVLL